jgi:DNA-binding MarR family transcriptional regulator
MIGSGMSMEDRHTIEAIAASLDHWYSLLGRQYGPLSRPQRRLMRLLSAESGVRAGDLTASLGQTTAGTTRMIDMLEGLGYVRRARLPDTDQRQVYVALTTEGAAALAEADLAFVAQVEASLAGLTDAERESLAALLHAIAMTERP